jgi:RNase P/RNase MRP subunit p30
MTKFADLHVSPRVEDESSSRRIAELLCLAGYSVVALALPTGLLRDRVVGLRRVFEDQGVETVSRVDLSANSRMDLLRLLRRFRNIYDVVAVKCGNQNVASIACRDRRVDLVYFDPKHLQVRFSHPLASLLRGTLEFNLISTFLGETGSEIFSRVAKEAAIAREHGSRVVLSSGCTSPAMVRSPSQISAIGRSIGLPKELSNQAVSEAPLSIIERNHERRSHEYIEEGVKVVTPKAR